MLADLLGGEYPRMEHVLGCLRPRLLGLDEATV